MRCAILILLLLPAIDAFAQAPADTVVVLDEIHIEATRSIEAEHIAPFSLFILQRDLTEAAMDPARSLQDVASRTPGLWIADRDHLALGERISLRGASARSPFGTRGIQIFLDGIPITAPDGQAMTEIIDPAMIRRMEVIRGPASTFWGNASAGTLYFSNLAIDEPPSVMLRAGSFGSYYAGASGTATGDEWNARGYLSHRSHQGFRDHADGIMSRGGLRAERELNPATMLRVVAAGAWLDANSPGSLTAAEWDDDATAANPSYIRTASGKESMQVQAGLFLTHGTNGSVFEIGGYGILREMVNPLPYAVIDLSRMISGARANFTQRLGRLEWSVGLDAAVQSDGRLNFSNNDGRRGEVATLDQQEQVATIGGSIYGRYRLADGVHLSSGLRADFLRYSLNDNLAGENDRSGSRDFQAISPSIGVSATTGPILLYGSIASSFETPTTTELVNRPDGQQGFNTGLDPERTLSLEAGARGALAPSIRFDVSVFRSRIQDRLLSYQTEAGGDRTFFRNADTGHHTGGEVFLSATLMQDVQLTASYSLLHATFVDVDDERRRLPGVPRHFGSAELALNPEAWRIWTKIDAASGMFADDANAVAVDGFATVDLGIGHEFFLAGSAVIQPFVRIDNVLNASYSRSLVVNASFDRFFEPAPGRSLHAGVTLSL